MALSNDELLQLVLKSIFKKLEPNTRAEIVQDLEKTIRELNIDLKTNGHQGAYPLADLAEKITGNDFKKYLS